MRGENMTQTIDINQYPSIVSNSKETWGKTTSKYEFIPTTRIIDILADNRWFPVSAAESRIVNPKRHGYQEHMLRFRQEGVPSIHSLHEAYAEIVVQNSHDGSRAFRIMGGVFVQICGNGLVVSEGLVQSFRIKHIGFTKKRVEEAIDVILAATPRIGNQIEHFNNIRLTENERIAYAESALWTKYDEYFLKTHHIDAGSLFTDVRPEEKEPTLWNTFNIVQEKVISGGIRIHGYDENGEVDLSRHRKSKQITSIQENIRLNRALWNLTEHTAELKVN
jgi:hypothetical protein